MKLNLLAKRAGLTTFRITGATKAELVHALMSDKVIDYRESESNGIATIMLIAMALGNNGKTVDAVMDTRYFSPSRVVPFIRLLIEKHGLGKLGEYLESCNGEINMYEAMRLIDNRVCFIILNANLPIYTMDVIVKSKKHGVLFARHCIDHKVIIGI